MSAARGRKLCESAAAEPPHIRIEKRTKQCKYWARIVLCVEQFHPYRKFELSRDE